MSSPSSCTRCSEPQPQALLSPGGLCPVCAATEATAEPTSVAPTPAGADSPPPTISHVPALAAGESPTRSASPAADTASVQDEEPAPLPHAPPGYELIRHLGGGGMGDVFLARELASERLVAIKFLRHTSSPTALQRFVTELQALAKLDNANIVRMFAPDVLRATPFFTMEYLEGGSLSSAIKDRPPSVDEAVRLIRVVAGAVAPRTRPASSTAT